MDRNREARRGTMATTNGGLPRRRQRGSSLRDSPEEDVALEMQETTRLRDRGGKKDRDRDRSSRSKRRRGDRMMHESHREEGEESSEESIDDEGDDVEEDALVAVRVPPPPSSNTNTSLSVMQSQHHRKGFPASTARPSGTGPWKVAEEMIGAPIPRKARSSSVKKSQECWVSGGEQVHRQASTSPSRASPSSMAPVSPSSSNASVRKKIKQISGTKHRPPKTSKASSSIQEIEIEVAEVLFGMTRQVPPKQESLKNDSKEANGLGNEDKSRISSPTAISSPPISSQPAAISANLASNSASLTTTAHKRKRPLMKFDESSHTSPPSSFPPPAASGSSEATPLQSIETKVEAASPNSEKKTSFPTGENSSVLCDPAVSNVSSALATSEKALVVVKASDNFASDPMDRDGRPQKKAKEETVSPPKQIPCANLGVNLDEPPTIKSDPVSQTQQEEKFSIDLMSPPPGKASPEIDTTSGCVAERKTLKMEIVPKVEPAGVHGEKMAKNSKKEDGGVAVVDERTSGGLSAEELDLNKQVVKERNPYLQHVLENPDKDVAGPSKHQSQKQPSSAQRADSKIDKTGPSSSLPLPMQITGWPGGFPPYGYMGQVSPIPPVASVDRRSSKSVLSSLSSQIRPKRCATHCYVAQNIHYHQQIVRSNPFWASAASAASLYGPKQYNFNAVPSSESVILGCPLPGFFPGRSLGSVQEKGGPSSFSYSNISDKEKLSSATNPLNDASQKNPTLLPQSSQPGSSSNKLASALIFPLNQQQATIPPVTAANRSGVAKLTPANANLPQSLDSTNGPGTIMNFNYPGLPSNEAQYLAFLQNNGYPLPIPAHVSGAPALRGANSSQAMPFYNLSVYPQMFHPSQIRQQPQPTSSQQPGHSPQGHQNQSNSSGSSSSQKQHSQQSERIPLTSRGNSQPHSRQPDFETGCEDPLSTAESSRVLLAQKSIYNPKFTVPVHSQNFALISPASAAASSSNEKQQQKQKTQNQVMKMDLTSSQTFAVSFASFAGAGEASPNGLDFSSMAQNALFQGLPEAARHGHQISAAAAAASHAAQQQQQQQRKKPEEGRSASELANSSPGVEEEKITSMSKVSANTQQHALAFSRGETEPQISSILSNTAAPRHPGWPGTAPLAVPNSSSQQQVFQMQRQLQQQQQRAKLSSSSESNGNLYTTDRLPGSGSNSSKFPPALAGFPPALTSNNSSTQSPQWKSSVRPVIPTSVSAAPPPPSTSSAKNQIHMPHQQIRGQHQTQISFGVTPAKVSSTSADAAGSVNAASLSSSTTPAMVSVSKSSGGSPRSSSSAKSGPTPSPVPPVLPFQKQQFGKHSSLSSYTYTPLPTTNRNMPSILGNPHINSGQNSSSKTQISQHRPPKQQFPQSQFFFSNPYVPAQTSNPDATSSATAGGGYFQQHQRRTLDQQQQQNSTGMLCLGPSSLAAPDQSNSKSTPPAGILQHPPSGGPHPLMTAAATAFPYIHTMQSVSLKPAAEQKPAAGR